MEKTKYLCFREKGIMLSIIYPYRERDLKRIQFSLRTLSEQTSKEFKVYFVDYGSPQRHAKEVKKIVNNFPFASYSYLFTEYQPWNKSKALNSVIKKLESNYFFVADIDMLFHPGFVRTANELTKTNEVWYFQVGFLNEKESDTYKEFNAYNVSFKSGKEATGLTMCSVKAAKRIQGFDEFYHFWGSEDTDFHVRLINAGYEVNYYDKEILMLHKWHKTYRNKETNLLTTKLQAKDIVQFNQLHLNKAINDKVTVVNLNTWGDGINEKDFMALQNKTQIQVIYNLKTVINYFLFQQLANLKEGTYHFQFKEIEKKEQVKIQLKQILKPKKKPHSYFSLKRINDLLLYHIVNYYHHLHYSYQVDKDFKSIYLSIKVNE